MQSVFQLEAAQDVPHHEHLRSPDRDPKREMNFNHPRCMHHHCFGVCTTGLYLSSVPSRFMAVLLAICRRDAPGPIQMRSLNERADTPNLVCQSCYDTFHQHPGDPEQAQSADLTCCIHSGSDWGNSTFGGDSGGSMDYRVDVVQVTHY